MRSVSKNWHTNEEHQQRLEWKINSILAQVRLFNWGNEGKVLDSYTHSIFLTDASTPIDFGLTEVGSTWIYKYQRTPFYMAPEQQQWETSNGGGLLTEIELLTEEEGFINQHPDFENASKLFNQLNSEAVTRAADVWTLGYNAYEFFYGQPPLTDLLPEYQHEEEVAQEAKKIVRCLYGPVSANIAWIGGWLVEASEK